MVMAWYIHDYCFQHTLLAVVLAVVKVDKGPHILADNTSYNDIILPVLCLVTVPVQPY
jgi:hypothetical protein